MTPHQPQEHGDVVSNTSKSRWTISSWLTVILSLLVLTSTTTSTCTDLIPLFSKETDCTDPVHPYHTAKDALTYQQMANGQSFRYVETNVGSNNNPVLRGCSEKEQNLYGTTKEDFDGLILQ